MPIRTEAAALVTAVLLSLNTIVSAPAAADPLSSDIVDAQVINDIRVWLANPVVGILIDAQNKRLGAIPQDRIDALDGQWRAEREKDDQPLIAATLSNPLSIYVTQVQAGSVGLYTEIIVMDAKGLNVGQSSITSDFWQGDEAKFQKTYPIAPDAVFVDEAEFHDGSGTWRAQVNLSIANASGAAIGAVTVEVNLTELARRQALAAS
ncbi:hypothetical protein [Pacificispira sp.]|uniref:hypothetical protein n=1 Tax=Pacificispira sp. TaxID=2888761 RepID=UPI002EA50CE7|nr:hypothetical protein [Pseudomonadota bacterium]